MKLQKKEDGKWHLDFEPNAGKKPRFRRKFETKAKALLFYNAKMEEFKEPEEWEKRQEIAKDDRRLHELVELWWRHWGSSLRDGARIYNKLLAISTKMGDPLGTEVTSASFSDYIEMRMSDTIGSGDKERQITNATVNRDHSYLRAMYNKLIEKELYKGRNPVEKLEQLEETEQELTYYDKDEIKILFNHLDESNSDSVSIVADICLSTGARWGEAQTLRRRQVKNSMLQFIETKGGAIRFVPISDRLNKRIMMHSPHSTTFLFSDCLSAFRRAIEKSGLESPRGQLTHVLRHSMAVNFVRDGGNIYDLQLALGHKDIKTTAMYLRFAPKHLLAVKELNPMSVIFG